MFLKRLFIQINKALAILLVLHLHTGAWASDAAKAFSEAGGMATPVQHLRDQQNNRDVQGRTVYIQLKQTKNAAKYQIQIRPFDQKWASPYVITSTEVENRIRLTPSHYAIRTRAITEFNEYSPWSDWADFWVHSYVPEGVFPANNQVIPPLDDKLEKLTFEWPHTGSTGLYFVEVRNEKTNEKIFSKVVNNNWFRLELPVAQKYRWTINPLIKREAVSALDRKNLVWNHFEIEKPLIDGKKTIYFEVTKKIKVKTYQYEITRILPNKRTSSPSVYESYDHDTRVRLGPGAYDMRSRYILENGDISDWSPPQSFAVKLPNPKLLTPALNEVLEPSSVTKNSTKFTWENNVLAERYTLRVKSKKTGEVKSIVVTEPEGRIELPEDDEFTWEVLAHNVGESLRAPASLGDPVGLNFSYEKLPRLYLTNAEEPGQWYGWIRTMSAMIDYRGDNYDNNTRTVQNIVAGSTEGATGYWFRKTNLGAMAHYSTSGFTVRGITYDYASFGAHLGFRQNPDPARSSRVRYWLGFSYREFPELIGNLATGGFTYSKVATSGPQFKVAYLDTFNDTWGYESFGEIYNAVNSIKTPTGMDTIPVMSFKAGVYLTYRPAPMRHWMFGYAYNQENLRYKSMGVHGDNEVFLQGHYLSIILETSFLGSADY